MAVLVGASGWQYSSWRGAFYPHELPQARWLEHYARCFRTVEVDNTFYRLPGRDTFEHWSERTPDDFVVTVKASRYLTHIRRLREPEESVERLMAAAAGLQPKLGAVLLQLPPDLRARLEDLDRTLSCFPTGTRLAVEPRHASWFNEELQAVLGRHDAALCLADRYSRPVTPLWRTASWGYLRMHEGRGAAHPCYGRTAMKSWASRLAALFSRDEEVFVYFNNDSRGCAVRDARHFAPLVSEVGLEATRTRD